MTRTHRLSKALNKKRCSLNAMFASKWRKKASKKKPQSPLARVNRPYCSYGVQMRMGSLASEKGRLAACSRSLCESKWISRSWKCRAVTSTQPSWLKQSSSTLWAAMNTANLVLTVRKVTRSISTPILLLSTHWQPCKLQMFLVVPITLSALELSPSCFRMDVNTQSLGGETTLKAS